MRIKASQKSMNAPLLALLLAVCAQAQAAVVTVNQTVDLTQTSFSTPGFTGVSGPPAFTPPYSVTLAEGDTFDFTIDFLGSQTLTLTNASFLWAFSYSLPPSTTVDGTGTLSLLDAGGLPFLTSNLKNSSEGSVHFGQQFTSADFPGGLPASLTFSGLRYVGTLNDYLDPAVTSRTYQEPAFYFTARGSAIHVPEPGTLALLGLGLAGLAASRRRKQ